MANIISKKVKKKLKKKQQQFCTLYMFDINNIKF